MLREVGRCRKILVTRVRCVRCRVTGALIRALVLGWKLDTARTAGAAIGLVAGGGQLSPLPSAVNQWDAGPPSG